MQIIRLLNTKKPYPKGNTLKVTDADNNAKSRTTVFLSYAHEDRKAVDELLASLAPSNERQ